MKMLCLESNKEKKLISMDGAKQGEKLDVKREENDGMAAKGTR